MAISYANIQVTKVLTLRGNTIQNNRYTGLPGELTVDTQAKTIRIHDGVTPGGNVIQGASGASSYANANVKVYLTAFDGNIIPSANAVYSLGTVTNQWKSLFVSNSTIYVGGVPLSIDNTGNLTVNGNTIPTVAYVNTVVANVTVDLSSYALNANVTAANVGMKGYVDQQITDLIGGAPSILDTLNEIAASINDDANVYTSLTNSIATANTALKGYVDSQSFYSNAKVSTYLPTYSGNIAANITKGSYTWTFDYNGNLILPNGTRIRDIGTSGSTSGLELGNHGFTLDFGSAANDWAIMGGARLIQVQPDEAFNVMFGETGWQFGNTGTITFPDATVQSTAYTGYGNVQVGVYANLSTYAYSANVIAANVGIIGYIDQANTIQAAAIVAANVGLKGYVDSRKNFDINGGYINFSASPAIGTDGITFNDGSFQTTAYTGYGNVQVGIYTNLSTYAWNANVTAANVGMKGYVDNAVATSGYSNVQVAAYLPTYTGNVAAGNVKVSNAYRFETGNVNITNESSHLSLNPDTTANALAGVKIGGSGYLLGPNSARNLTLNYNGVFGAVGLQGNVTIGTGGSGNLWVMGNVLARDITGNNITATYFIGNGSQLTGLPSSYSNVQTAAYLNATGYNLYSNVNVAAYLSTATINTTGNITAQNLTGNINITGNVVGTSPNVTIQAGGNVWIFDNTGNLTLPTNADIIGAVTFTGNVTAPYFIGNGALLTGIAASSNYSNVNVATYLPTYSGNIANIRLGASGVLTFADGTTQITAGGGSYSNVQVAAYLTTGISTAAPQIQFTNATSNYIKYNNVGVGAPTFTTSNVGTRIIYWSSVDANTADYAVGIDAGTLWHGIPRATSGFAFKWYGGTTQIAMLEGTGSFTIANIRLSPSGNIVFADGTVQTTAATGTYSNIQVATYLPTYTGSLNASNILVTSANITIANIQATTAATNPATGALRVMGGVGVAGAVVAGQLNSTGNVVANAISAYSLNTVANVVASVVNAGTINSAGNILAQNIIGTIATASQTGITAVGTLATLSVTGNATVGNLVGTEANTRIIANVYTTTFDIYGNVSFPGNVNVGGLGVTMPTRPAFRVNGTAAPITTANVNLKGSAITTIFNQGNYLDTTTGKFTAPIAGIYEVLLNARVGSYNGLSQIAVLKNGNNSQGNVVCFWEIGSTTGTANHFGVSGTINLVAGDYLSANILAGNISFDSNDNWCVTYLG